MRAAPALLLLALAAGCAPPADAPGAGTAGWLPLAEALRRLPAEAAGFRRGSAVDAPGLGPEARTVDYATPSRAAAAQVSLFDRGNPAPDEAAAAVELDAAVRDATALPVERTGRSLVELSRRQVPVPGGGPLSCAVLDGRFGRNPVERHVCLGVAGGRLLRVQVTVPDVPLRGGPVDPDAFAVQVASALRAR
ncbi:hypothetical protein [Roseomonas sp. BN140053]|uniref:hypothetical protein n=1 Tax=Roseomonas sp. BN140053 TaxID=3391898 RepID=UPI0039EA4FB3